LLLEGRRERESEAQCLREERRAAEESALCFIEHNHLTNETHTHTYGSGKPV